MQYIDVVDAYALVDLVNRGVDDAELNHFEAMRCDKEAIRGTAARGHLRRDSGDRAYGGADCRAQRAGRRKKGLAGHIPFQSVFHLMLGEDVAYRVLQAF